MRLKHKITCTIIPIVLLQVVIVLVPSFMHYQDYFNDTMEEHINSSLANVQNTIERKVSDLNADSAILAQNIVLNRYLNIEDEAVRSMVMLDTLYAELATFMKVRPDYIEVSLLMLDGYEEVALLDDDSKNLTDEEHNSVYFKHIKNSPADHEVTTILDPDTNQWVMVSARKIYQATPFERTQSTKKQLKAYLILKLNLDFIRNSINNTLLSKDGFLVIHDDQNHPIIRQGNPSIEIEHLMQAISNNHHPHSNMQLLVDGESYMFGHQKITSNLYFCLGWPKSSLDSLFMSLGYSALVNSILFLFASMCVLYWAINRQVIKPILNLGQAATLLGQGNKKWSFDPKSDDELAQLGTTIKEMGYGLIKQKRKLHDIAYVDSLTDLQNRRRIVETLEHQFENSSSKPTDIALLFLDLDEFKHINDTLGHVFGDQVLIAVAGRLKQILRQTDNLGVPYSPLHSDLARLGGDEFTILLRGIRSRDDAERVARRILHAFSNPVKIENKELVLGISIGIALAAECGESPVELLKNADIAMYDAKHKGKNTFKFFSRTAATESLKIIEIKESLHNAITNHELQLAYQPKVCTDSGKLIGCEALLRWKHPEKGWIRPDIFIPIAEQTGLIAPIGRWVILEACHQMKQWQQMGYNVPSVSVNVSCVQLARENVHSVIRDCLSQTGVRADKLVIEVTESSIMQGDNSIIQLENIRAEGAKISLDDFGTGYSSLSVLKGLPIDELKIDRSFINSLNQDENGKAIVSAIIAMAHQLDLQVVAEGVETEFEFSYLLSKGVDVIQGYYFSKPLMKEEFTKFLSSNIVSKEQSVVQLKTFTSR